MRVPNAILSRAGRVASALAVCCFANQAHAQPDEPNSSPVAAQGSTEAVAGSDAHTAAEAVEVAAADVSPSDLSEAAALATAVSAAADVVSVDPPSDDDSEEDDLTNAREEAERKGLSFAEVESAENASNAVIDGKVAVVDPNLQRPMNLHDIMDYWEEPRPHKPRFGLRFDIGSIEGGMMALEYRALPELRVHAGIGSNSASLGYRGGIDILPWGPNWAIAIEAGHFMPGDIRGMVRTFAGNTVSHVEYLRDFSYDFASLQGGWEYERAGVSFFARAGVSVLRSELSEQPETGTGSIIDTMALSVDPLVLILPSVKMGFVGFL